MNRATSKYLAVAAAVVTVAVMGLAAPSGALGTTTGATTNPSTDPSCKGTNIKPTLHKDAVRRENALSALVSALRASQDPYGLNGAQIAALQDAKSGITTLDGVISGTCYPTLSALHEDGSKLFVGYRVFWLRVPQTFVIVAADHLAEARIRLGSAAGKLAPLVGSNAAAQADLAAMNQALTTADGKLGVPPNAGATIAAVPGLVPAKDMSQNGSVLRASYADLLAARAALMEARSDGKKTVADLQP